MTECVHLYANSEPCVRNNLEPGGNWQCGWSGDELKPACMMMPLTHLIALSIKN